MAGDYEKAITIQKAMENIVARRYLLPAIQRKFTWSHTQICVLFDSIMRGYPINTFMFWEVTKSEVTESFRFYQFLEQYCERFGENNPNFDTKGHGEFFAVIDGQQRLTSLYIGLKGTYAYKLPRKWWPRTRDEAVLPTRRLYLDLSQPLDEEGNEQMVQYNFQFLTAGEYSKARSKGKQFWFEVGKILDLPDVDTVDKVPFKAVLPYLRDQGLADNEYALETLTRLYFAIRRDPLIHYYNETSQEIDHVLDIFVRTNSGGTPLAFSDLLMSIAVANWKNDARQQIDDLVDHVRFSADMGFSINRDVVLKTCLMLTGPNVKFKVQNFTKERVKQIEKEWDEIKACVVATFRLLRSFGLNDASLRAKNAAIPIAFYLYQKGRGEEQKPLYSSINNLAHHHEERKVIRKWLHMSLLKGVFGGQGDAVLTKLRTIIGENLTGNAFPLEKIVKEYSGTNKDLNFDDEFIERILATQKDDSSCFSILALLFPDLDYTRALDKDHLHPASAFGKKKLKTYDFLSGDQHSFYENPENWNSIANLHLLDASLNKSKNNDPLDRWVVSDKTPLKRADLLIPENVDLSLTAFPSFIEERSNLIRSKLKSLI